MEELRIITAENGFIVYEGNPAIGNVSKSWAFETAESLAEFIARWGRDNTKTQMSAAQRVDELHK